MIKTAKELGIAYVAYSPLGHGWLVDDFPYNSPDDFPEDDARRNCRPPFHVCKKVFRSDTAFFLGPKFQGENFTKNKAIVDEIKKLAAQKKCTTTQLALAWVAAQGLIPITGTTKAHRLETNFASREVDLTEEEMKAMRKIIDAAKPHGDRYNAGEASTPILCWSY